MTGFPYPEPTSDGPRAQAGVTRPRHGRSRLSRAKGPPQTPPPPPSTPLGTVLGIRRSLAPAKARPAPPRAPCGVASRTHHRMAPGGRARNCTGAATASGADQPNQASLSPTLGMMEGLIVLTISISASCSKPHGGSSAAMPDRRGTRHRTAPGAGGAGPGGGRNTENPGSSLSAL